MPTMNTSLPRATVVAAVVLLLSGCAANVAHSSATADSSSVYASEPMKHAQTTARSGGVHDDALERTVQAESFDHWLAAFRAQAVANGVSPKTVAATLAGVRLLPRVVKRGNAQPEFSRRIWSYLDILVTPARVRMGRRKLAHYADIAAHTERQYGVPRAVIGAIWGIESSYGDNFGSYDTVAALATLAFEGRRREWAARQLYAVFKIVDRGLIGRQALRGSWAGAMGHTQFLPTSYLAYAIDGDSDGQIDIWRSIPDVMASTANYLVAHDWRRGSPWGVEVVLPASFDYGQSGLSTRHSTRYWRGKGVSGTQGAPLPIYADASVLAPAGARGPAFLVGPNFDVIMSYNHAISYALAVGLLADRLAGDPGIRAQWPRGLKPLSHDQIFMLQRLLNRAGFDAGTPDGIVGPNTRGAVRAFQRAHGLTADGFVTRSLLRHMHRMTGRQERVSTQDAA